MESFLALISLLGSLSFFLPYTVTQFLLIIGDLSWNLIEALSVFIQISDMIFRYDFRYDFGKYRFFIFFQKKVPENQFG